MENTKESALAVRGKIMKTVELKRGWHNVSENGDESVSLPFVSPCYGRVSLETVPEAGGAKAFLFIDGAEGVVDVFADGECVGTAAGAARLYDLGRVTANRTRVSVVFEDGGAINRGAYLHLSPSEIYIPPYGLFVRTERADESGAQLSVSVSVAGECEAKRKLSAEISVLNAYGRRSCRRKKNFTFAGGEKTVTVAVPLRRAHICETDKPYFYTLAVRLLSGEEVLDEAETRFGVRVQGASRIRGLTGATAPHENGVLGGISLPEAERRKLSALRDIGCNAVRYVGCPSEAALAAADELGLSVVVDIFDNWTYPREGSLSHLAFAEECEERARLAVRLLRNHPCVAMYSVANGCEETYGRRGAELARRIVAAVREEDGSRPVACTFRKLEPTERELIGAGASRAALRGADPIALGDELSVPSKATAEMASLVDVCICAGGFEPPEGTPYLRADTRTEDAFASLSRAEDDEYMLGDFSESGMDRSSHGVTIAGDVDHTCLPRAGGRYRAMLTGAGGSFILVGGADDAPFEGSPCWKADTGETVRVTVFTPGDVVALYLNGYLVGRRLAGRVNKQYAVFEVEYAAGTLEAVSYLRGRECCRTSLTTPEAPSRISLLTGTKKISASAGEVSYVDVWVIDAAGGLSVDYDGDVEIETDGDGEIVALGNEYGSGADDNVVTAVAGHALVVVRGKTPGKLVVKPRARGLRGGRLTITVTE